MAEILEHPWMLNPTPGIIVHPAPSVADLARPFASSAFIEEEVLESLHVVCGKQMSFEQLTAELCSPPGQGEFVKAFYYLLDQHRRLTLHENGIHLDVQGHDPSVRTVSKQYSRPVSRTTSRMSSTLEVDLYGRSNSRSDSRSKSRPKTPPVGPLPPVPEGGTHTAGVVASVRRSQPEPAVTTTSHSNPRLATNASFEPTSPLATSLRSARSYDAFAGWFSTCAKSASSIRPNVH
jgi:hypothetical protein